MNGILALSAALVAAFLSVADGVGSDAPQWRAVPMVQLLR